MLKRIPLVWKLSAAFFAILILLFLGFQIIGMTSLEAGTQSSPGVPLLLVFLVAALALNAAATWWLVNQFVKRPVRKVLGGMNRLAEKEFDYRLEEDEEDEFGELVESFNDMATMLSSSLRELKKNQDYLQGVVESSADIIVTLNSSGNIQMINTGAENILGYRRMDVVGESVEILLANPEVRKEAAKKLQFSENVVNYETQFITKGKEIRDALLTLSRMHNRRGEIIGFIVIGKDITEEKRLQKQLIQNQRFAAIGQVFTGIQHSMKNMLNACKGGAYMVRTGLAKENQKMLVEGWDMVQEGITKLTEMSTDMLKYVKEFKPKYNRVDLSETLTKIAHVITQTANDKGIEFSNEVCPELPAVACDASMINSTVMDIVSNALDACVWKAYDDTETPEVRVRAFASDDGEQAIIEIKDNGCGMTDSVKANIFTPFFSTKSKAGTGLGLAIASRMIEVHNGRIEVESEPDRGTVFHIVLPVDGDEEK